jgi:hypothetical protein
MYRELENWLQTDIPRLLVVCVCLYTCTDIGTCCWKVVLVRTVQAANRIKDTWTMKKYLQTHVV